MISFVSIISSDVGSWDGTAEEDLLNGRARVGSGRLSCWMQVLITGGVLIVDCRQVSVHYKV